jgi:PPM family protein phosphatase
MSEVSLRGAWTVSRGEACDRGKVREENQDTVRSATIPLGELFLVADGIGGYQGGATASRMVAEGFYEQLASQPAGYPAEAALREACAQTNASIQATAQSSDPSLQRMGSTVVLALIQTESSQSIAFIGHVGDSRAYLIRNNQMTRLTTDHSAVQALLNRNLITEEQALYHPDASVLTRSLGHRPDIEIDINRVPIEPGDGLLLCSDGLWGYVAEEDIAAVATDSELSAQTIADTLLHQALAAGGQDNIGIEFVRIEALADASALPAPQAASPAAIATHSPAPGFVKPQAGRARTQQISAIALLLLAGCGFLGYAAYNLFWPMRQSLPASPAQEKKILVVGDAAIAAAELQLPYGAIHWQHIQITRASRRVCANLGEAGPVLYASPNENMAELSYQHPELEKVLSSLPPQPLTSEIRNACGNYDVILILPKQI